MTCMDSRTLSRLTRAQVCVGAVCAVRGPITREARGRGASSCVSRRFCACDLCATNVESRKGPTRKMQSYSFETCLRFLLPPRATAHTPRSTGTAQLIRDKTHHSSHRPRIARSARTHPSQLKPRSARPPLTRRQSPGQPPSPGESPTRRQAAPRRRCAASQTNGMYLRVDHVASVALVFVTALVFRHSYRTFRSSNAAPRTPYLSERARAGHSEKYRVHGAALLLRKVL